MELVSFACRACHKGWWRRPMPEKCPECKGTLVITGHVESIELVANESR